MACKRQKQCHYGNICMIMREGTDLLGCSLYKPKMPQTNKEWMQTANDEELAEQISNFTVWGYNGETLSKEEAMKWLQEKHNED